jgi:hypothetical protein
MLAVSAPRASRGRLSDVATAAVLFRKSRRRMAIQKFSAPLNGNSTVPRDF